MIGSDFDDDLGCDESNNRLEGGLGSYRLTGHSGLDLFVAFVADGDKDIITDFETLDDKIVLDIDDPSSVVILDDLYEVLSITITSHTNQEGGNQNDTIFRFDRGEAGEDASDYLLILEEFTDTVTLAHFELI